MLILAFEALPRAQGLSYEVTYRPILFAGLLKHHGQLGPAEIGPKRDWTYRQVLWQGREHGIAFDMPRLTRSTRWRCCAWFGPGATRHAEPLCNKETIFRHVWQGGAPADDAARLEALTAQLAPGNPASDAVKHDLRAATDAALAADVFYAPTFAVDGRVFWGLDAVIVGAQLEGDTRVDEV